jgi:hypothetical protein
MVSVYLNECDTWSDGLDEHEEDHFRGWQIRMNNMV